MTMPLPEGVTPLLPEYLARQRWYAGSKPDQLRILDSDLLVAQDHESRRLWWAVVDAGGARWQLLLGERLDGGPADFLHGHEDAVLGLAGRAYYYDGTLDPGFDLALLDLATGGAEEAERVRPVGAEQSNTSLVYDDRVILKLFRRLIDGPQPDVEVTSGLTDVGFEHVPKILGVWRRGGDDLAVAQEFLVGGVEGWALALTSLRDYYASAADDPSQAGGDFQAEARRLGQMAAEMHLALAGAFGVFRDPGRADDWADGVAAGLHHLRDEDPQLWSHARSVVDRLHRVSDPGAAIRVHGDFHLGQVMRTDAGWYVLDFEGEPARGLEERTRPTTPLKDVAGMLRSFQYAARVALRDQVGDADPDQALERRAGAWEDRNRRAFLEGYLGYPGVDELLPGDDGSRAAVMTAFELDKAIYELAYERSYRPEWIAIPRDAIRGLIGAA
jgi:maltokinase